jgi:thiamine-monophosphate kinase
MESPGTERDRLPLVRHATLEVQTCSANGAAITQNLGSPANPGSQGSLGSLGEFGLIRALPAWLPAGPGTLVGIGDDAAVLATPDGRVVATTDFLLEGRHFRRDWSLAADVGHKAAARSLADVAAMGAVPTGVLVALAAPADLPVSWLQSFTEGLAAECGRAGASVIGGDTARAGSILLAVTALGDLAGRAPVLRSGARPGDVVAVCGPLGHAAAGLALLNAGLREPADLVAAQLRPTPPYDAGPEAALLGATAMIDTSDGLLADLGHIADASNTQINIKSTFIRTISGFPALTTFRQHRPNPEAPNPEAPNPEAPNPEAPRPDGAEPDQALTWALAGGEDHSLAATFPPGSVLPARWHIIGEVCPHPEGAYPAVVVDGQPWTAITGWDHFG